MSIASADISLLEDQNAKLLDKLEKLEAESISADHAGRRELKRLEKEITFLRESLEKTQAKSEELEERVQGAVVGEAWRRKKEREAKFKAMRNLGRNDSFDNEEPVRNFAPEGSRHGGPSDGFSFFPTSASPNQNQNRQLKAFSNNDGSSDDTAPSLSQPEHALISQLLIKVQELEETNSRILQQQSDTAVQLSAVQRDTAHITKVYETLADSNTTELELDHDNDEAQEQEEPYTEEEEEKSMKFSSLKRSIESKESFDGTCIVRPEFGVSTGKKRASVMGLFDEPDAPTSEDVPNGEGSSPSPTQGNPTHDQDRSSASWMDEQDRSTWSSVTSATAAGLASPLPPGALSPLHFFSPATHAPPELSPTNSRPTLQHELDKELGNNNWELHGPPNNHHLHMRALSLYDFSQISVPPTPSPLSRTSSLALPRRMSNDNDSGQRPGFDDSGLSIRDGTTPRTPPLLTSANSLRLSVEPPTPSRLGSLSNSAGGRVVYSLNDTRSPRMQMMSDTLRSRTNRWVDRRFMFQHQYEEDADDGDVDNDEEDEDDQKTLFTDLSRPPSPLDLSIGIPNRLSHAVDSMIEGFNSFSVTSTGNDEGNDDDDDDDGASITAITPLRRRHGGHVRERSVPLHAGTSPEKKEEEKRNSGFLLQVWLWLQFAIVVFVFLYAMARRGPTKVLTEDHKRAVARRR